MNLFYHNLPDTSVLCLLAPTASGKTQLAFELYRTGRFELISVDSALVYQEMNIGTAKPSNDELRCYPHHLVNIIDPTQSYDVANFVATCQTLIEQIHNRGRIPLLVGGTMMYYHALFYGIASIPKTTSAIRQQVKHLFLTEGNEAVYDYLKKHDPVICQKLTCQDRQRIGRAMEVHLQTGRPLSAWQQDPTTALSNNPNQQWYALTITPERAWLHKNIEQRLESMWQAGFVAEVRSLIQRYPLSEDSPSMHCVGYRQVLEFLLASGQVVTVAGLLQNNLQKNNKDACQNTKNKALYSTRQLAKRQYTWLRKLSDGTKTVKVTRCTTIQQARKLLALA